MVQWEWKSNPGPYSPSEGDKWTPYKPNENDLIEKAFHNHQKEVELGDYIVSIKDMLQKRKDNAYRQRPVRRSIDDIENEENVRAERFFGTEIPKTFNDTFGNLEDYLKFFQKRCPEIKEFAALLNDIEASNNINLLNQNVQPCLVECIQNEAKKIPTMSKFQKQYLNKLLTLFQEAAISIKEFYANVLKAYTMAGFLYQNLNLYLRNEDWSQLDSLLPYAYCLCKAFLRSEFLSNIKASMTVYRGARFDETSLSFYDLNMIKSFCWNGVTSTSKKLEIAEKFMKSNNDPKKPISVMFIIQVPMSLENASKWINIAPYSALPNEDEVVLPPGSVFELKAVSREPNKNVAEIHLTLVVDVEKLAHQGLIMHGAMNSEMGLDTSLKLVCLEGRELSDAVTHLKGNQLIEELEFSLCKFDKKVALSLASTLENIPHLKSLIFIAPIAEDLKHWSAIFEHLRKASIENLKIYDNDTEGHQLYLLGQGLRELIFLKTLTINLSKSQITDEGLKYLCQGIKYLTSLTSLTLSLELCSEFQDLKILGQEGIRYLTSLTSLVLNFGNCEIRDEGLKDLSQGIKYLTSLRSFNLKFGSCFDIKDEGLNHLASQGIKHLISLTSLSIHFEWCEEIGDEGLKSLGHEGIKYLTSLTSLSFNFKGCEKITDKGLCDLSQEGIKYLTSLTSLSLNFGNCEEITDDGLKSLCQGGLECLTSLTSLSLDFYYCSKITDEGLKSLNKYVTSLSTLSLNFGCCDNLTFKAIKDLYQGIKDPDLFKLLALNFECCDQITEEQYLELERMGKYFGQTQEEAVSDPTPMSFTRKIQADTKPIDSVPTFKKTITLESLENLQSFIENNPIPAYQNIIIKGELIGVLQDSSWGKSYDFTSFRSLTLNFCDYEDLTNKDLENLAFQGLQNLTSLEFLTLVFQGCEKITNKGIKNLCSQGIKYLTSLTSLTLNFSYCRHITDEGLKSLCQEGIKSLTSLTSLNLNFLLCFKITDETLKDLYQDGLRYLISLKSLTLNFSGCEITDKGLENLSSQGLKNLTSLESLTLEFQGCDKITNEGLKNLVHEGIKYLTLLKSLTLGFGNCTEITDEGLRDFLQQGIINFISPISLTLDFGGCQQITDKGFKSLCQEGIKYLTSLTSLSLNFNSCPQITDEALKNLHQDSLKYLISLKSLALNFAGCEQITDEGLKSLGSQGLKYQTSLTSLNLGFSSCEQITNDGLSHLYREGIKQLTSLKSMTLQFYQCFKTTDESLNNLCREVIKYLTKLTYLDLNFRGCQHISGVAFQNFCKVLGYFGFKPVELHKE